MSNGGDVTHFLYYLPAVTGREEEWGQGEWREGEEIKREGEGKGK